MKLAPVLILGLATGLLQPAAVLAAPATQNAPSPPLAELAERVKALEANARQLQQQAADALAAARAAQAQLQDMQAEQQQAKLAARLAAVSKPSAPRHVSGIGTGNAFNPAIAVILNGLYTHHSSDPETFARSGNPLVGEGEPRAQGLSLGESEMTLAASIDDKFYGQMTVSVESEDGEDHLGLEEAYIDATALPAGFGLRAGRFFSNIGYLNSHHAHTDFFSDRPLAYQALLGNQYGDDGIRLTWVAPTSNFVQVGGEVFRGASFPAAGAGHHGAGAHSLFVHLGGDLGVHNAWYAGISALRAHADGGEDGFTGTDTLYIADGTWKWSRHGNFKEGGVLLRGEYMLDRRDGSYGSLAGVMASPASALAQANQPWTGSRRGLYLEGVYQFNRFWNAGYRYDKLWAADQGPYASDFDPWRHSLMLSWHNSEFSLLRLQYSHEKPADQRSFNTLTLQYQVALGAHGAHKF